MPSMRRVKVFGLLVFLFVITLLFWTASLRQQRAADPRTVGDFYAKTVKGLGKDPAVGGKVGETADDDDVVRTMERLKEAAEVAKSNANAKAPKPDPPSSLVGVGSAAEGARQERSVAGRKKIGGDAQEVEKVNKKEENKKEEEEKEEEEKEGDNVEVELSSILQKAPIIIFSKSYCPHSARAKTILLEKYILDPAPFVVELDQHPFGPKLQAYLAEITGRSTVPNVLINGKSIGGGDDVAALHAQKSLVAKIKSIAGKKMMDVRQKPLSEGEHVGL